MSLADPTTGEVLTDACPCGEPATETDHIWPRYWGGIDHPDNLQRLCGTCNRRKGARVDVDNADPLNLARAVWAIAERAQRDMEKVGSAALARLHDCGPAEQIHLHMALALLHMVADEIERAMPSSDPTEPEIVL